MTPPFDRFVRRPWYGRMLSIDPGQTTGWALWERQNNENPQLVSAGQWYSFPKDKAIAEMEGFFESKQVSYVVLEEYRIYKWKTDMHANSDVFTLRLIGMFEYFLGIRGIPIRYQGAGMAKGFCTDEKLKDWNFWHEGQRHARDATRHGAYFWCTDS